MLIGAMNILTLLSLLTNPVFEHQYRLTFQGADSGPVPSLCIEPLSKPKKLSFVQSWLSNFNVFVAIYTKKFDITL